MCVCLRGGGHWGLQAIFKMIAGGAGPSCTPHLLLYAYDPICSINPYLHYSNPHRRTIPYPTLTSIANCIIYSTLSYSTLLTIWNHIPLTLYTCTQLSHQLYLLYPLQIQTTTWNICLDRGRNKLAEFGYFHQCGTAFYLVRYGAVRCIHLVIPPYIHPRSDSRNWPRNSKCLQ